MSDIKNNTTLFMTKQSGGHFTLIDQAITTGNVFFVDDATGTDTNGYGQSPQLPFASLDFAVSQCTASNGDIIYCMPYHAESTSVATTELFDTDIAGITVLGLGRGDARPTFTLEHATATVVVGAANCRVSNIRIVGNVTDLAKGLEIEAAATNCRVDHCYIGDSGAALDMLVAVEIAANADGLIFEDNHINITIGGEATECLEFLGGCDGLIMRNNIMVGDWKTGGAIEMSTAASTNVLIRFNTVSNHDGEAGLAYNGHASTTGGLYANFLHGDKNGTVPVATTDGAWLGENYGGDEPNTSGIIIGTPTVWT